MPHTSGFIYVWDIRAERFAEAISAFNDSVSSTLPDDQHSTDERRFIQLGMSSKGRVLFVVYTETDSTVRLIGARGRYSDRA